MFSFLQDCNKLIGTPEPDMLFDDPVLMCVPSRNSDRWVYRYEENLVGQLLALMLLTTMFNFLLPKIRLAFERFYQRQEFYSTTRMDRMGYFGPIKTELKYDSGSAVHHFVAGVLMTVGWFLQGQTLLFRLGVLTEVSIELLDIIDMMFSRGLWATVPKELGFQPYFVMLAHHLPGIGLILPLNLWCSCVDIWQRIAITMELIGGLLLLNNVMQRVVDDTPWNHLFFNTLSMLGWIWSRFYIATPLMIQLCKTGLEYECKATYALIVGGSVMTLFNAMIVLDFFIKIYGSLAEMSIVRRRKGKID